MAHVWCSCEDVLLTLVTVLVVRVVLHEVRRRKQRRVVTVPGEVMAMRVRQTSEMPSGIVFGNGFATIDFRDDKLQSVERCADQTLQWACACWGGVACADSGTTQAVRLYDRSLKLRDAVPLPSETNSPVGMIVAADVLWVACFGYKAASGLLRIERQTLAVREYWLPLDAHVHNVYEFTFSGKRALYVAALGNIFDFDDVLNDGFGLVEFDRHDETYDCTCTLSEHVRAAVQRADESIVACTQEPHGLPTRVMILERSDHQWNVRKRATLPDRAGGDGGADVVLMPNDRIAVSDRCSNREFGKVYLLNGSDLTITSKVDIGHHPRFMTYVPTLHALITCNKDDDTALHETASVYRIAIEGDVLSVQARIPAVDTNPSFVLVSAHDEFYHKELTLS